MDEAAPAPPQAPQRPPASTEAAREAARRIQQATAEVARNFGEMVAPSAHRRAADPRPGSGPPVPGSPVGENPPAIASRGPGGTPAARLATPEDAANHAVLVVQLAAAVVRLARRVANGDDRPAAWGGLSENAIRNMRRLSDALVGHDIGVPLLQALRRSCGRVFVVSSVSRASAYEAAVEVSRRAICAATDRLPTELHPGLDGSGECTWTDSEVAAALTRLVSERADLCSVFDAAGVDRLVAEVRLESARAEAPRQPDAAPAAGVARAAPSGPIVGEGSAVPAVAPVPAAGKAKIGKPPEYPPEVARNIPDLITAARGSPALSGRGWKRSVAVAAAVEGIVKNGVAVDVAAAWARYDAHKNRLDYKRRKSA